MKNHDGSDISMPCLCTACIVCRGERNIRLAQEERRRSRDAFVEEVGERAAQIARAEAVIRAADAGMEFYLDTYRETCMCGDCRRARDYVKARARYRLNHERSVASSTTVVEGQRATDHSPEEVPSA